MSKIEQMREAAVARRAAAEEKRQQAEAALAAALESSKQAMQKVHGYDDAQYADRMDFTAKFLRTLNAYLADCDGSLKVEAKIAGTPIPVGAIELAPATNKTD